MLATQPKLVTSNHTISNYPGRWVTAKFYAKLHDVSEPTLSNWRFRDSKAGLKEAPAGFPQYRRFGRSIRYWLPSDAGAPKQT